MLLAKSAEFTTVSYRSYCQSVILRSSTAFTSFDFVMLFDFCSITERKTINFSELDFLSIILLISVLRRWMNFFPVEFFGRLYFLLGRLTISLQYFCHTLSS